MGEESHCLKLSFDKSQKELVLMALYSAQINCFQEGRFGKGSADDVLAVDAEITCYFANQEQLENSKLQLQEFLPSGVEISCSKLDNIDWREAWKEHSQPSEISPNLIVCASWHKIEEKPGQQRITIDPQMAFGTGSHPTTKMCLKLLESCFSKPNTLPNTVLDIGCGSGILSIAADLFGASEVLGIDIEHEAVVTSAKNAAINQAWNCQFAQQTLDQVSHKFEVVLANILSSTLVQLWPDIIACTTSGSTLIVSGLLAQEQDDFLKRVGAAAPDEIVQEDSWIALRFSL